MNIAVTVNDQQNKLCLIKRQRGANASGRTAGIIGRKSGFTKLTFYSSATDILSSSMVPKDSFILTARARPRERVATPTTIAVKIKT